MIWCFVKGFGSTTAVALGVVLFFWLNAKISNFLQEHFVLDESEAVGYLISFWAFVLISIFVSLLFCGVIK